MNEEQFKIGDWIRPADDMYDSVWKSTRLAKEVTEIDRSSLQGPEVVFHGSYSIRQSGRFKFSECRHATEAERSAAIRFKVLNEQKTKLEADLRGIDAEIDEIATVKCPTCGHRS